MMLSHIYFLSEIGGKANQEDFIWPEAGAASLTDKVFIVCDGIGGSENGEIASKIIAETAGSTLLTINGKELSGVLINSVIENARDVLVKHARQHGMSTNMGTTFTLVVLFDNSAFIAWCGDSRIYHVRKNEILYKTTDHSLINSLIKTGEITEEEALVHPKRNIIFRAIKADDSPIQVDHHIISDVQDGDYLMLCTDGILENITDKDLQFLIKQNEEGNIDIIEGFQQFCKGKTRDNYSMYLLKTKSASKPAVHTKKIVALIAMLVLLIAASLFFLNSYFNTSKGNTSNTKEKIPAPQQATVLNDTTAKMIPAVPDTKPGALMVAPDTTAIKPVQKLPAHSNITDTLSTKKDKRVTTKKIPNIIMVDNSADTTRL